MCPCPNKDGPDCIFKKMDMNKTRQRQKLSTKTSWWLWREVTVRSTVSLKAVQRTVERKYTRQLSKKELHKHNNSNMGGWLDRNYCFRAVVPNLGSMGSWGLMTWVIEITGGVHNFCLRGYQNYICARSIYKIPTTHPIEYSLCKKCVCLCLVCLSVKENC